MNCHPVVSEGLIWSLELSDLAELGVIKEYKQYVYMVTTCQLQGNPALKYTHIYFNLLFNCNGNHNLPNEQHNEFSKRWS